MRDMLLNNIIFDMSKYINNYQLEKLKETINHHLYNLAVIKQDDSNILELDNTKLLNLPDGFKPLIALAVGYPIKELK